MHFLHLSQILDHHGEENAEAHTYWLGLSDFVADREDYREETLVVFRVIRGLNIPKHQTVCDGGYQHYEHLDVADDKLRIVIYL